MAVFTTPIAALANDDWLPRSAESFLRLIEEYQAPTERTPRSVWRHGYAHAYLKAHAELLYTSGEICQEDRLTGEQMALAVQRYSRQWTGALLFLSAHMLVVEALKSEFPCPK